VSSLPSGIIVSADQPQVSDPFPMRVVALG
jgi:hypothetical protein